MILCGAKEREDSKMILSTVEREDGGIINRHKPKG